MEKKDRIELKNEQLDKVTGGNSFPKEPEDNSDKPVLENLQDNKGANEN